MPKLHDDNNEGEGEEEGASDRCTLHPDTRAQVHPPPALVHSLTRIRESEFRPKQTDSRSIHAYICSASSARSSRRSPTGCSSMQIQRRISKLCASREKKREGGEERTIITERQIEAEGGKEGGRDRDRSRKKEREKKERKERTRGMLKKASSS